MGKYQKLAVVIISAIAISVMSGCQKSDVANGAANAPAKNTSSAVGANTSNSANTASSTSGSVDLSSPTATYKTAYNARKNKDIPTLKRVLSKDVQDFLTDIGRADDNEKKSLDDMLKELCEQPQADKPDVRNEKITGDKATLEYLDEAGSWQTMDLVNDNGEWKITIAKDDKPSMGDNKESSKSKSKK